MPTSNTPPNGSPPPASTPAPDAPLSGGDRLTDLRSMISLLGGRLEFAAQAGLSHLRSDTADPLYKRDLWHALGLPRVITYEMMYDEYKRGDIAERIAEAKPNATWSNRIRVTDDPKATKPTPWERAHTELWQRLDLAGVFYRADVLANIGHYSVVLLGLPGNLSQARRVAKPEQLLFAVPYGEDQATIQEFEQNHKSPRYGLPLYYSIDNGDPDLSLPSLNMVHHSRVIHVCEGNLTDRVYGKPILRSVYNKLQALFKVVDGGAEAAWNRMDPGRVYNMDPEAAPTPDEIKDFQNQIEDYRHKLERDLRLRGIDVKTLDTPVAGFSSNAEFIVTMIAATTGIPKRIFMGSEQGQQAGSSDRLNWNGLVDTRKDRFGTPLILGTDMRFVELGVLPRPRGTLTVQYPPVQNLSPDEIAEVLAKVAVANQAQRQSEGTVIMSASEMRVNFLNMDRDIDNLSPNADLVGDLDNRDDQPLDGRVQEGDDKDKDTN